MVGKTPIKTACEKEKMLVTIIFSFSHNVFNPFREKFDHLSHTEIVVRKSFKFGMSSAKALNLENAKIFLYGKGLTIFLPFKSLPHNPDL